MSPKARKKKNASPSRPTLGKAMSRPTFYNPMTDSRLTELKPPKANNESAPTASFNNLSTAFASSQNLRSSRP